MTREYDIKNAAWDYFQDLDSHHFHLSPHCNSQTDAFEAGAKWADKTMIEKACAYLYAKSKMSGSEINSLKKAMEE